MLLNINEKEIKKINENIKKIRNYFLNIGHSLFENVDKFRDIIDQKFTFDNVLLAAWFFNYFHKNNIIFSSKNIKIDNFLFKLITECFLDKLSKVDIYANDEIKKIDLSSVRNFKDLETEFEKVGIIRKKKNIEKSFDDIITGIFQGYQILTNSNLIVINNNGICSITDLEIFNLFFDSKFSYLYSLYFIFEYFKSLFIKLECID
ncbi:MAG: hypothetical protein K2H56_03035, partial [Malacoplasma sp.]|nr:hypothetical protein [Malacoplasma sp.]